MSTSVSSHCFTMLSRVVMRLPEFCGKGNVVMIYRCSSTSTKMQSWQIYQYGGIDELSLNRSTRMVGMRSPNELVVKVNACSVNPLDVRMIGGYGRSLLNVVRKQRGIIKSGTEFPLVLGRDFSGTVLETGRGVKGFTPGDEVWGAVSPFKAGTLAQYAVVSPCEISRKPSNVSHVEAASLPFVALTTWSALATVGALRGPNNAQGKRILLLTGSGGIGTFAIQLAKAWGMDVTVTCGADAHDLVTSLGADTVLDYRTTDVWQQLRRGPKFDMILDCVGGETTARVSSLLSPWNNAKLVTLSSPVLRNSDSLGVLPGLAKSVVNAGLDTLKGLSSGASVRWAAFTPNPSALETVGHLVETGQIKPVVQETFSFQDVPKALQRLNEGQIRGKFVIDADENPC